MLRRKLLRYVKRLALTASTVLAAASCSKKDEQPIGVTTISVQVVHGPEVRSYLGSMVEKFQKTDPRLSDGSKIAIELVSELGVRASRMIADGEIKSEAWLAPSSALVNMTNASVTNLGAGQTECTQLFSSPTVIAVPPALQSALGARDQQFDWNKLFTTRILKEDENSSVRYSHGDLQGSVSGLTAVLQLAAFSGGATEWIPAQIEKLRAFESEISQYSLSDSYLLDRAVRSNAGHVRFVLTSEQQVETYNKQHMQNGPPLLALYPVTGAIWQDYTLCLSAAPWMTTSHHVVATKFKDFLSTPESQQALSDYGFRPSISKQVNAEVMGPQLGVNLDLPKNSAAPASGEFVSQVIRDWAHITRPAAVLFVADSSSNVDGDVLRGIKDALRSSAVRLPERTKAGLISFSTEPTLRLPFTEDRSVLIPAFDQMKALGGSALYDAIKLAVDTIGTAELKKYRKTIVVLTMGEGKSSELSRTSLQSFLNARFVRENFNIIIVGISQPGADYSELRALSQETDAVFKESGIGDLESTVQDLIKNL